MNFEGSPNVSAVDEIPLRFRSAVRPISEELDISKAPLYQTSTAQDIVEKSGVPRSWLEKKQKVELHSLNDERYPLHSDKVVPEVNQGPRTLKAPEENVKEDPDGDSDDTIQIKVGIRNRIIEKHGRVPVPNLEDMAGY